VGEIMSRALSLAEQIDRAEHLVPLIMAQWVFHLLRAEHKRALALAERMERIGETRNDTAVQMQGRHAKGLVLYYLGELVAAHVL